MKVLAYLLAVLIGFGVLPSLAEAPETYLGDWELTEMTIMDTPVKPASMELSMVLTILEDGGVLLVSMHGEHEEREEGTWAITEEGLVITFDEVDGLYVLTDSNLVFTDPEGGGKMVYSRTEATAPR